MNLHSSFSLQSENINISVLFPMITVYKASLGWKWIVFFYVEGGWGVAEIQWSEIEEAMSNAMQHKAEGEKKRKSKRVRRVCVEPIAGILTPPVIILKILNLD